MNIEQINDLARKLELLTPDQLALVNKVVFLMCNGDSLVREKGNTWLAGRITLEQFRAHVNSQIDKMSLEGGTK